MPGDTLKSDTPGSSCDPQNIYETLEIASPKEMFQKAKIVESIIMKMKHNGITLTEASTTAKISNERLTQILMGHFHNISLSELEQIKGLI